eukprot:gene5627-biopygen11764
MPAPATNKKLHFGDTQRCCDGTARLKRLLPCRPGRRALCRLREGGRGRGSEVQMVWTTAVTAHVVELPRVLGRPGTCYPLRSPKPRSGDFSGGNLTKFGPDARAAQGKVEVERHPPTDHHFGGRPSCSLTDHHFWARTPLPSPPPPAACKVRVTLCRTSALRRKRILPNSNHFGRRSPSPPRPAPAAAAAAAAACGSPRRTAAHRWSASAPRRGEWRAAAAAAAAMVVTWKRWRWRWSWCVALWLPRARTNHIQPVWLIPTEFDPSTKDRASPPRWIGGSPRPTSSS